MTAAAPTTTTRSSGCIEQAWRLHPQYVLENGVDFAHFKFVHQAPIVPIFTRQDFDDPVSYVDFTITFEATPNRASRTSTAASTRSTADSASRSRRAGA